MLRRLRVRAIFFLFFVFCLKNLTSDEVKVQTGLDRIFQEPFCKALKGKKIGLITNQTAVNKNLESSVTLFCKHQESCSFELVALFAPEHGLTGAQYAGKLVQNDKSKAGIPIYSLHGQTRRPTKEMLKNVNLLVFDIQDIGSRSYTYASTLCYVMEEAAKNKIPVMVLDRPNPINGIIVDGPFLEDAYRSFVGYVDIPYCHGLTIGELASYFNSEYKVGVTLQIVPMLGWKREMSFEDTGLPWIPTSPNVPEATTPVYYPMTGPLGEFSLVSIGIGYTLPFKVVGAPWIDADAFVNALSYYKLSGIAFVPVHFRPFAGSFSKSECHGALLVVKDQKELSPIKVQYAILAALKRLYPEKLKESLRSIKDKANIFHKVFGSYRIYEILQKEPYPFNALLELDQKKRAKFLSSREKYLLPDYK